MDINTIKAMPETDRQAIYRYQEHQYLLEDARTVCEEYDFNASETDLENIVAIFEKTRDCNIDTNTTWECAIEHYQQLDGSDL